MPVPQRVRLNVQTLKERLSAEGWVRGCGDVSGSIRQRADPGDSRGESLIEWFGFCQVPCREMTSVLEGTSRLRLPTICVWAGLRLWELCWWEPTML